MKTTILVAALVLELACAHAKNVEDPSSAPATSEADSQAEGRSDGPSADVNEKPTAQKEGRVAGGTEAPNEIPVASSPSGLLKPGAEQRIRDKLGVRGGSMREALKKFQKEHDLPATGLLDDRTTEALGFDPDDIFERATGQ